MRFAPKPENDFLHYIRTYYDECRARFPKIESIAGKWTFRDLIPGMSDFDTRFIVSDQMGVNDWCEMSDAVGEAHLQLCRQYPAWARNLEHLPGINLTWTELFSEECYYPEYKQWSFYHSEHPQKVVKARMVLSRRPWDNKDEYFYLKKFCLYYGRYNRDIDPAINLGVHANKYPLHSRIMHYFVPPVHSAMILLNKQNIVGKFEALEIASKTFPDLKCWEMIDEILHAGYEIPEYYKESLLVELENAMERALESIAEMLKACLNKATVNIDDWKNYLIKFDIKPEMKVFDNIKFARLMKGRLKFYAKVPKHFDFVWLIHNELERMENNFFKVPFSVFWKLKTGEDIENPLSIIDQLKDDGLCCGEINAARELVELLNSNWRNGREQQTAMAVAGIFDMVFSALHKIYEKTKKMEG